VQISIGGVSFHMPSLLRFFFELFSFRAFFPRKFRVRTP
jgi:hypothetical protein